MNTKKTLLSNAIKLAHMACVGMYATHGFGQEAVLLNITSDNLTVKVGDIDASQTASGETTIDIGGDYGQIDWGTFNLGENESVNFDFRGLEEGVSSSSYIIVNKVLDAKSDIFGDIISNGHVVLINPRGVLFSETSTVNVAALTVSSLASTISKPGDDGNLLEINAKGFGDADGEGVGLISNSGRIVAVNGDVTFLGNSLRNLAGFDSENGIDLGTISAVKGTINMVAAGEATVTFDSQGLVSVLVTGDTLSNELEFEESVFNSGDLEGAHIIVESRVADSMFVNAINNSGTITAKGIDTSGGTIKLMGSSNGGVSGSVVNSGQVTVSSGEAVENAGEISILAEKIELQSDSLIQANGGDGQSGGTITIASSGTLMLGGNINATGGVGDSTSGGEVITRSGEQITIGENQVFVVTNSENSVGGTWEIEAEDIVVSGSSAGEIDASVVVAGLESNAQVVLSSSSGNLLINNDVEWSGSSGLYLNSNEKVFISDKPNGSGGRENYIIRGQTDADLVVSAANGFDNHGEITVSSFALEVGVDGVTEYFDADGNPVDSEGVALNLIVSNLGNISVTGGGPVNLTNLGGFHGFNLENFDSITDIKVESFAGEDNPSVFVASNSSGDGEPVSIARIAGADQIVVDSATLHGTEDADKFELITNGVAFGQSEFVGVTTVNAGVSAGDVLIGRSEESWNLNSIVADSEGGFSISGDLIVKNLEILEANNAGLTGTTGNEEFTVATDKSVTVAGSSFRFTGLNDVTGGGGNDTLNAAAVTLTGNTGEVEAHELTVRGLKQVNTANVTGASDVNEEFVITDDNAFNESKTKLSFTGVTSVSGGESVDIYGNPVDSDSVKILAGNDRLAVTFDNEVSFSKILFSQLEVIDANGAGLGGTAGNEEFTVATDKSVTVAGSSFRFTGLNDVTGGGGNDTLNAAAVTLTGNTGEVEAHELTVRGLKKVNTASVTGASDVNEEFVITDDNAFNESKTKLSFTGVTSVSGGESVDIYGNPVDSDSVKILAGNDRLAVTFDNEVSFSKILFSQLEVIDANGAGLGGTAGNEEFTVATDKSVTVAGSSFRFTGLNDVAGGGGNDTLNAAAVTLTGNTGEVEAHELTVRGLKQVNTASVTGASDVNEEFVITGDNAFNESKTKLSFTGVTSVSGGESVDIYGNPVDSDSVKILAGNDRLAVTFDNEVSFSKILFSQLEVIDANGAGLGGTAGNEEFTVATDKSVTVAGGSFRFTGLNDVTGGGGNDTLNAAAVTLTGNNGQVRAHELTVSGLKQVNAAQVTGSGDSDTFVVAGAGILGTLWGMGFAEVTEVIAGGTASTATGADGINWELQSDANVAQNNGIDFRDFATLNANNAGLTGTTGNEEFTVATDKSVTVAGSSFRFTGLNDVTGGGGNDTLNAAAVTLTGKVGEVEAHELTVRGLNQVNAAQVTGSGDSDTFVVAGAGILDTLWGMGFAGVTEVIAGGTASSATGADGINWLLQSDANVAQNSGIDFRGFATLNANNAGLTGTTDTDVFTVATDKAVTVAGGSFRFTGLNDVTGGGGNDTLNAAAVTLTGKVGEVEAHELTVRGLNQVNAAQVTGSGDSDTFVVAGAGILDTLWGMGFAGVTEVIAGGTASTATGADGINWELQSDANVAQNNGIDFRGFATLNANNAGLTGTTGTDVFTVATDKAVTVAGSNFRFTGLNDVAGGGGNDTLNAAAVTLTGNTGEVEAHELTVRGLKQVNTASVTGASDVNEEFVITDDNAFNESKTKLSFTGVTSVSGGESVDIYGNPVDSDSVKILAGNDRLAVTFDNEVSFSKILFSQLEVIDANGAGLGGTAGNEEFTVATDKSVTVAGSSFRFTGLNDVTGGGGNDTLNAAAVTLTGKVGEVEAHELTVRGLKQVNAAQVTGNSDSDTFVVTGAGILDTLWGMEFSGVSEVIAGGTASTVTGADGINWELQSDANVAQNSGIDFRDFATLNANNAGLTGTTSNEEFTVATDKSVTVAGSSFRFTGLNDVAGGGGNDTLNAAAVTLTGNTGEVEAHELTVRGLKQVNAAQVTGSGDSDTFVVAGAGILDTLWGMGFAGVTEVIAGGTASSATGADGINWLLQSDANVAQNSGIDFRGFATLNANNAGLTGTTDTDVFTVATDKSVTVAGGSFRFTGLNDVTGGGGNDTLNAAAVTLTGNNGQVRAHELTVSGLKQVNAAQVTGSGDSDTFVVAGAGILGTLWGMGFAEVTEVIAGGTASTATGADGINWELQSDANVAQNNGIDFRDFATLNANNAGLTGTTGNEEFTVATDKSVTVAGSSFRFTGLNDVTGGGGNDTLNAAAVTLTGKVGEVEAHELTVRGLNQVNAAQVTGSGDSDTFVVAGAGILDTLWGMGFAGVTEVIAGGTASSATGADGINWLLQSDANVAQNSGIDFRGFATLNANNAGLTGTTDTDVFTVATDKAVTVAGGSFRFTGLNDVTGGGGNDTLNAAAVTLTGKVGEVEAHELTVRGLNQVNAAQVTGSGDSDTFVVAGAGILDTLWGMGFAGVTEVIAGGTASTATGADGINWELQSDANVAQNNGIDFRGFATLNANNAGLTGTTGTDVFTVATDKAVTVAGSNFRFTGLNDVAGGGGDDTLNAAAVTLTGNNGQVRAHELTVRGLSQVNTVSVTGSAGNDAFSVSSSGGLDNLWGIAFVGVEEVIAGSASNSVTGAEGVNWLLQDTENVASNNDIDFQGFSSLIANNAGLTGTIGDDTFMLSGSASNISVGYEDMTFTGLTGVNGNGSATGTTSAASGDHLNTSNYTGTLTLTGTSKQIQLSDSFAFTSIDTALISELFGASGNDTFTVTGSGAITTADMGISGLSTVDGAAGNNVLVADGTAQLREETVDGETISYAQNGGIKFYDIGKITADRIEATDGDDQLAFTADGVVTVNTIEIGASTYVDAGEGDDTVTGFDRENWIVKGDDSAENYGVTFDNVEFLIAQNANLLGTDGNDAFTLNSNGTVNIGLLTVSGMSQVLGLGGTNSLNSSGYVSGLTLNGTANQFNAGTLLFSDFASAQVGTLTGTSNVDQFVVDSEGGISVAGMRFTDVATLSGAGGIDTLASNQSEDWVLTATGAEAIHGKLTLKQVESLSGGNGRIVGNTGGHDFTVTGNNMVSVSGLQFAGISRVDAATGSDSVAAAAAVTLAGNSGAFSTSEIAFTGIESVVAESLVGSTGADTFALSGSGALSVFDMAFTGLNSVTAGGGADEVISRAGQGYALAGDNRVLHESIQFAGIDRFTGNGAALGVAGQDSAEIVGEGSVFAGASTFSGLTSMNLGDSGADLQAWSGVALTGTGTVSSGGIAVSGVTTVSATDGFTGTSGDDEITVQGSNALSAGGIVFSGVNTVAGGAGEDRVTGVAGNDWRLQGTSGSVAHGAMTFTAVETAVGGSGHVVGGDSGSGFAVTGNGTLQVDDIVFSDVISVAAGQGDDSVATAAGERWTLDAQAGSASVAGIQFSDIDQVNTVSAIIDGSGNGVAESFVLGAEGNDVSVLDILFASVAEVFAGAEENNRVASAATNWALASGGAVVANGVRFNNIDQVSAEAENTALSGNSGTEEFALTGNTGEFSTQNILFSGFSAVTGNGGGDAILGTGDGEAFSLNTSGGISVAGLMFNGISQVDAGGGDDSVSGGNGQWASEVEGNALVNSTAIALLDNVSVLFENLEQVVDTGAYSGPAFAADYRLTGPASLSIGGVTFSGVQSIAAGSGSDTLFGLDADLDWTLGTSDSSVSGDQFTLRFSGIDSLVAGAGADSFQLQGGALASLDTGAGDDIVYMSGTLLDSLMLGAGDDLVQLLTGSQPTLLSAGSGSDRLEVALAGQTWEILGDSNAQNRVGGFRFSEFEQLADLSAGLNLVTSQQLDFTAANDAAGVRFSGAGMDLAYNPIGDLTLTSSSRETIGGSLRAANAVLNLAGDLDIASDVQSLSVSGGGANIDVSIVAERDLHIGQIDAGRGDVSLSSASFGVLTAETFGDTHITAANIFLGNDPQFWGNIGTEINPLRMDASQSVNIVAFSYYEPAFVGRQPVFTASGERLQSIAGAQTAQGLKSAIQNPVDDIAQLDPGIFSEVAPYSLGIDALNLPEVRLHAGELVPMNGSSEDDEDELEPRAVGGR